VSYQQIPVKVEVDGTMHYRFIPGDTKPTPATGYIIFPDPTEIPNIPGKFWLEYKITTP